MILTDRRRTNAGGLHFVKGGMAVAQNEHDFSKGSIPRNIMSLAVPMTAAQLVNVLYSVVDRIYLGRLPGSSHLALTGLGIKMCIRDRRISSPATRSSAAWSAPGSPPCAATE